MSSWRVGASACIAWSLSLGLTGSAAADVTKTECIAANTRAQELRRSNKLTEARAELRICLDPKCPNMVLTDCTRRMAELENAQPTIVFDAKSGAGADLSAVKVTMDGKPLLEKLDGSAVAIDPGEHAFTFEVAGEKLVAQHFILKEGEKARHERIVIGSPPAPPPPPKEAPPLPAVVERPVPAEGTNTPPPSNEKGLGAVKLTGIAAGGAGLIAIAVGAVFGELTASAIGQQKSDCSGTSASSCTDLAGAKSEHSKATSDGAVSTGLFVAGGALIATGLTMLLWPSHASDDHPTTGAVHIAPSVAPGAAGIVVGGSF